MSRNSKAPKRTRRYIQQPPTGLRPADITLVIADLERVEVAGLRAAVELRGLGAPDLADMLCDVIERVQTIHGAAIVHVRTAVPTGGEQRG